MPPPEDSEDLVNHDLQRNSTNHEGFERTGHSRRHLGKNDCGA